MFECLFPGCGRRYNSTDATRKHARKQHRGWIESLPAQGPSCYCREVAPQPLSSRSYNSYVVQGRDRSRSRSHNVMQERSYVMQELDAFDVRQGESDCQVPGLARVPQPPVLPPPPLQRQHLLEQQVGQQQQQQQQQPVWSMPTLLPAAPPAACAPTWGVPK